MTTLTLNPQQQKAVHHLEGPMLVVAGAGSGKTRVVTERIAHLIALGIPSSSILAVTFTNKAAEEMSHRIQSRTRQSILACTFHSLGARIVREESSLLGFSTAVAIYDEEESEKLLKETLRSLGQSAEKKELELLRTQISAAKNSLLSPQEVAKTDSALGAIYERYQTKLQESSAVDFDDLLYLPVQLLLSHPATAEKYQARWSFLLIDEYQDTNHAQYLLTKLLAGQQKNLFAVGDPDQSIYSWRGACLSNILDFEKDYPGAVILTLDQNYRSHSLILQAANHLISHNESRYQKNLWSDRSEGEKPHLFLARSDQEEARFAVQQILSLPFPLSQCAIFYRTNFQSRSLEDALLSEGIPYKIIGGLSFYQRKEIKDILAYLRLAQSGIDIISFLRIINLPKRGLGNTFVQKLQEAAEAASLPLFALCQEIAQEKRPFSLSAKQKESLRTFVDLIEKIRSRIEMNLSLAELIQYTVESSGYLDYLQADLETAVDRKENLEELAAKAAEWEKEKCSSLSLFLEELSLKSSSDTISSHTAEAVSLMTLHNGKGLEFSAVFLVGLEEDLFPHINAKDDPASLEEERRLCYVGMTRAKELLYLSAAKSRFLWGGKRFMSPSRFLEELPASLLRYPQQESLGAEQDESSTSLFAEGDWVYHSDFGKGEVESVTIDSPLGTIYDVYFPQLGASRTLVAKYARLKKTFS